MTGQRDTVLGGRDLGFSGQGHGLLDVGFTSLLQFTPVSPPWGHEGPAAVVVGGRCFGNVDEGAGGGPPTPPPPHWFQDLAMYINEVKRDKETLKKISEFQSCIENLVSVADSPRRGD